MSLLKKLFETFGKIAVLLALFFLGWAMMYWVCKANSQLYKVVLRFFRIKYPFGMKSKSELIIGFLIGVTSVLCFEYVIPRGNDVFLLLAMIPATIFMWSPLDKAILQNKRRCYWFNPKRIWCD